MGWDNDPDTDVETKETSHTRDDGVEVTNTYSTDGGDREDHKHTYRYDRDSGSAAHARTNKSQRGD